MHFGCSSLLFGGYDLDAAVAGLQQAGYEAVELCAIPGMGEHFRGGEEAAVYEEIRNKLAAAGLALESVGCGNVLGTDRFEPLVHAAAALGAPYMTLGTGGVAGDETAWRVMSSALCDGLRLCERTGVKLAIMPHVRALVHNTETALRLLDEAQSPFVGLNLDNTHLQRAGDDPLAAVAQLREHIFTARIRDYRSDHLGIGPLEQQIPGKGQADVKGYYDALGSVPGLKYVVLEMVGAKDLALSEIQRIIGEALTVLRTY
jgi:sugar phosphate isomerase/epimerase